MGRGRHGWVVGPGGWIAQLARKALAARQVWLERQVRLAVLPARLDGPAACLACLDVLSSSASCTGRLACLAGTVGWAVWMKRLSGCAGPVRLRWWHGWTALKAQIAQPARLAWLDGPDVDPRPGGPTLVARWPGMLARLPRLSGLAGSAGSTICSFLLFLIPGLGQARPGCATPFQASHRRRRSRVEVEA